jgi:molybdenum cofactor synthesis domain-containing protein
MGKEQLYVWEKQQASLHEEEGAEKLCLLCRGENIRAAEVREGKIELFAEKPGLLKIDSAKLIALNSIDGLAVITLRGDRGVKEGEKIAAVKIIPLLIEEEKLETAAGILGGEKPINVIPYKRKKAGIIVTGNEIFKKRISDTGSEILKKKIEALGAECIETEVLPDEGEKIAASILGMIEKGVELVLCSGGMSVDPDDKTPAAIKQTGARIVSYGVPFAPGVMLLLSYYEKNGLSVPVIGAPACVFYEHTTALDILLPRLLADDPINREDLARLGEGGLGDN